MKIKLSLLLLLFSLKLFAQSPYDSTKTLQAVNTYGSDNKNGKFRGSLNIPLDTVKMAVKDSGAIAYKAQSLYSWNGNKWILSSGSGGGSDDTLPPQYADMNAAIAGGLTNGKKYRLPITNGNYIVAVVYQTIPFNAVLNENGQPMLNENGTIILRD